MKERSGKLTLRFGRFSEEFMADRQGSLDAIRGVAIAGVIMFHHFGLPNGGIGVDLFFVLSGFLIGGILIDNRESRAFYTTFYARRAARILPLYWLFLLFIFSTSGLLLPLWNFLVFGQTFSWVIQGSQSGDAAITWSLAVEEQFYFFLPALVRLVRPVDLPKVLLGCVLIAPLLRISLIFGFGEFLGATALLPGHLDTLCGGAFLAWLKRQSHLGPSRFHPVWIVAAVATAGLIAIEATVGFNRYAPIRFTIEGTLVAAALVGVVLAVALACGSKLPFWLRPLSWVGIGSYSIYLSNDAIFSRLDDRWTALAATCLFGWTSWVFLERPCIRWARRSWRYEPRSDGPMENLVSRPYSSLQLQNELNK